MDKRCDWCYQLSLKFGLSSVYWELPDGTRAIEIADTPTYFCSHCGMNYQEDNIIKEVEDQLFLVDSKQIGKTITFHQLMALPKRLKRNYFDFS